VAILPPYSESLVEEGEQKGTHEKRDGITRSTAKSESMGTLKRPVLSMTKKWKSIKKESGEEGIHINK
jgi:hypothetical protein